MPSPTWAQGQLLEVQLPFPAPHLQRPSDSGSHSRDSTPREQFSKGLIGQRLACSPFLPSLSLVAGVQGQTFDYWPEHLLPPSSPPYSLPSFVFSLLPSLSLCFCSCSLLLLLAPWSRPVRQGSTHSGWAGPNQCALPSKLAFPAGLPLKSSLGNLAQCWQPSSFLTLSPLWDPKGLNPFSSPDSTRHLFPTHKCVFEDPGSPRVSSTVPSGPTTHPGGCKRSRM